MSLFAVEGPNWVCSACTSQNSVMNPLCQLCGSTRMIISDGFAHLNGSAFHPAQGSLQYRWNEANNSLSSPSRNGKHHQQHAQQQLAHSSNGKQPNGMSYPNGAQQPFRPRNSNGIQSPSNHGVPVSDETNVEHQAPGEQPSSSSQKRDPRLGQNADEDERRATEEGRKVFVGNLKRPITRQEVIDHFSQFGEVERVILNSGFGLVLMGTREGALKATEQRWQALDWRNVEVFVYTKGAKGASWNRPYAIPPKPGPCAICNAESAEHCSLCTSSLCLNDSTTCVVGCRTCQRSFCRKGKECGSKDGLEACDTCGAPTCLFCALRLETPCAQCGRQFSERLQAKAKDRARRMVNARISENDGSVYALVCLLKGDMESSREGQLVASIDRASKLFDPKASSWCMVTALRAIKELDEAWEATRRVHNLRALRRSAKQWSTDLASLTMPTNGAGSAAVGVPSGVGQAPAVPPLIQQQQQHSHTQQQQHSKMRGGAGVVTNGYQNGYNGYFQPPNMVLASTAASNVMPPPSAMNQAGLNGTHAGLHAPAPYPHAFNAAQQLQQTTMATSNAGMNSALSNALLGAGPRGEDSLFAALRATEMFLTELDPRPKQETDWLVTHLRNIAMSVTKKRSVFLEELCMRVEVWAMLIKRFPPGGVAQTATTTSMTPLNALKRAVVDLDSFYLNCKSQEEFFMRKDAYLSELLRAAREVKRTAPPFSTAEMYIKRAGRSARNCEMRTSLMAAGVLAFESCLHHSRYRRCNLGPSQCPFSHQMSPSALPLSDLDQREFDAADYEFSNEGDELYAATVANIAKPLVMGRPSQQQMPSSAAPWGSMSTWSSGPPGLFFPPNNNGSASPMQQGNKQPMVVQDGWNSTPDKLTAAGASNSAAGLPFYSVKQQTTSSSERPGESEVRASVALLCEELGLRELVHPIASAFLASGAAELMDVWDTDLTRLHKELLKIGGLPAASRIKIINAVTARRADVAHPLPSDLLDVPVPGYGF